MQSARINDLLRLGPNEYTIFERDVPPPATLAGLIASLANTQGGVIVFGAKDANNVPGLRKVQPAMARISRAAQLITPDILIETQPVMFDGKHLIMLEVPQGFNTPYHAADGRILVRQGTHSAPATAEEATDLAQRALSGAALVPLTERDDPRRLRAKSAAPPIDLEHILLKLERLIIANAELTRKLDEANSWRSRITDQMIGAILGLVVSMAVFYLLGIG